MKRLLRFPIAVAVLTILTSTPNDASAQVRGFALDRFDPSERGSEWFALESLDLRGHGRPAVGIVGDWAHEPLVLSRRNGDVEGAIVEDQTFVHAGGTIVLWNRLRLGVNVPVAVYQHGEQGTLAATNETILPPDTAALGDVRLGGDVRLVGRYGDAFTLALGAHVHLLSGTRANYTGDETVRIQPRLAAAGDIGPIVYAARLAVEYRPDDRDFGQSKLGSQVLVAGALGLRLANRKLVVGPEVYGSTIFGQELDRTSTPLEGIFGFHYMAGDVRFGLGGGAGLTRGIGSPVARGLASLEWAPRFAPKKEDRDHDGIVDEQDACVDVPGAHTDDPTTNGCPPPPDRDRDGVIDRDDMCPDMPGIETADSLTNGCPPDRDKDGIFDGEDACINTPGIKTGNPKTNGCPPDRDEDGVVDLEDACPDVPGVRSSDPKTNGCPPDPDRDKDGILDESDACPDEPGKLDPDPKKNGCPKAFVAGGQIMILEQVKFATSSAKIVKSKDSEDVLGAVLEVLKTHPEITKVLVEGHTDNQGSAALNKKLSADRAASVVKWLTARGIDPSRLSSAGFGQERPIETNATAEGRKANRRVELHIVPPEPKH